MRTKHERLVIGLNSGTSADAIDAALVRFCGAGRELRHEMLFVREHPWPENLRRALLDPMSLTVSDLARLHHETALHFAAAARELLSAAGVSPAAVDLIGSHGQTVAHLPGKEPGQHTATLQIGDLDVIAERTGLPVIGDFRARDTAAGGQGAPLMPFLDHALFASNPGTVCLNLGGIANVTLVAAEAEGCMAFDTGPANMPLDELASMLTQGAESYDPGGRLAESGHVDCILLERLMRHPFVLQAPPKTTGREEFGQHFVRTLLAKEGHLSLVDILATLTAFVADSVHHGVTQNARMSLREVVVSGGGVHNLAIVRRLKQRFFPIPVRSIAEHGVDPDAKEALLFAWLAHERVMGGATNVPNATGARWPVGLGKLAW
jgi:anhydro-N-acetylmuramic acid kinase